MTDFLTAVWALRYPIAFLAVFAAVALREEARRG